MTPKKWNNVLKTLTVEGGSWVNEEGRVINKINLKPIVKVLGKIFEISIDAHNTHNHCVTRKVGSFRGHRSRTAN